MGRATRRCFLLDGAHSPIPQAAKKDKKKADKKKKHDKEKQAEQAKQDKDFAAQKKVADAIISKIAGVKDSLTTTMGNPNCINLPAIATGPVVDMIRRLNDIETSAKDAKENNEKDLPYESAKDKDLGDLLKTAKSQEMFVKNLLVVISRNARS